MTPIRVSLPVPIADALIESGEGVRSFTTRGPGTIEILNFAIEGINTSAAIVTLVGGVEVYRKVARQLRELASNRAVVVKGGGGEKQVTLPASDPDHVSSIPSSRVDQSVSISEDPIVDALEKSAKLQS